MHRKSVSGTWHYCQTNGIGIISRNDSPMRHMRQKGCGDNAEVEEDDEQ